MGDPLPGQPMTQRPSTAREWQSESNTLTLSEPTASLQPALRRIRQIAELTDNWDADGASRPSVVAVAQACLVIDAVAQQAEERTGRRHPPSTSAPIADGGLQVEWMGSDARIDVQIAPDGTLGYLTKRGHGIHAEYAEEDDVSMDTLLEAIGAVVAR